MKVTQTGTITDLPVILMVDDSTKNIQFVLNILRENVKSELSFATDGKQALSMVESLNPDLILLDVVMPDMDGFQVCEQLKKNTKTNGIPVIFLTAKTESDNIIKAFAVGAADYVTKPFNPPELLARVRTQLKLKRKINEQRELLHVLCHDLANPLSMTSSILEIVGANPDAFDESLRKELQALTDNGLELINLVRKMRALDEGKIELDCYSSNLRGLINDSALILRRQMEAKDIKLKLFVPSDIHVLVEPTSFVNSIMNNLITNAIKFSHPGGTITITGKYVEDKVEVTVKDQGIGIPDAILDNIFKINYHTHRKGTNEEAGTGFGMPLVNKFVKVFRGDINVYSTTKEKDPANHGTEVVMRFEKGSIG